MSLLAAAAVAHESLEQNVMQLEVFDTPADIIQALATIRKLVNNWQVDLSSCKQRSILRLSFSIKALAFFEQRPQTLRQFLSSCSALPNAPKTR